MGRMVLPSLTPKILLTSMQQPSQITTVPDSRLSRLNIRGPESTLPGPDGIHNNLLKRLLEDTSKILKDILNIIWWFPPQWRAATVIPIPKPNKDHANPVNYRPNSLTSCLCKVVERMINTRFIWYIEKCGILDKSQCGLRKHRSTTDHLVSLET